MIYLADSIDLKKESELFYILLLNNTKYIPKINNIKPWAISANMIANSTGKVIIVKRAGLISRYLGIP